MDLLEKPILEQLSQIGQEAEERTAEIEAHRCIPDDLMENLKQTGILHTWTATDYGGQQATILNLVEKIRHLAYFNGSLAWIACVTGTAALSSGYLQRADAKEIFGAPMAQVGGWAVPAAIARRSDKGLLVSGKWSWGSGIRHCSHIVGGVMIQQDDGSPRSGLVFMKPEDITFIDNWEVLGLRGSNSIDYQVKDLFIPDGKWIWFPSQKPTLDAPLYRFSFLGALSSGVAAVAIGLAARALQEIKELSKTKKPKGANRTLAERPVVHDKIARMEALHQSSWLFLKHAIEACWKEAEAGTPGLESKGQLRLAAAHAVDSSAKVIQEAYQIGGGSTIWDGVKLQELFRDVHAITQHGLVAAPIFEVIGRIELGMKVNEWLL